MAIICPKPVRACALRATLLDDCGTPVDLVAIPNSQIAFRDFMSLSFSPDIETGETFRIKNACGDICINDNSDRDKLLGLTLTLELCGLPIHMYSLLMGMQTFVDEGGDTIGGVLPDTNFTSVSDALGQQVMIEVWSINSDKSNCDPGGTPYPYIRWILPKTSKWQITGDSVFTNDVFSMQMSGYAESNPGFDKPVTGTDVDLTTPFITTISEGGPLAWIATDEIPTTADCEFVNPPAVS